MTEMFGEAWPPMSVPDLAPDDDDFKPRTEFGRLCPFDRRLGKHFNIQ